MKELCIDLEEQYQELDELITGFDKKQWQTMTPFFQWTVFDQVAHIAFFDQESLLAIDNPDKFKPRVKELLKIIQSDQSLRGYTNPLLGIEQPSDLLAYWRKTRKLLIDRLSKMSPKDRVIWYGPDMSALSFASARLMETWSHTRDILDTFGLTQKNNARLKHIAHIGVTAFAWSFMVRKLPVPDISMKIELTSPSGELWVWGKADAEEWVSGSAEEFCLVVSQRRNIEDTHLKYQGENIKKWLNIAQAFAGTPQDAPLPGVRVVDYK